MTVIELYRIAREFEGTPAELQTVLRERCGNVISVGDDLSFVVRLPSEIHLDVDLLESLGGKRKKLYPFRNCCIFGRGYIAWDGKFLRISREIDEKILEKILTSLDVE